MQGTEGLVIILYRRVARSTLLLFIETVIVTISWFYLWVMKEKKMEDSRRWQLYCLFFSCLLLLYFLLLLFAGRSFSIPAFAGELPKRTAAEAIGKTSQKIGE